MKTSLLLPLLSAAALRAVAHPGHENTTATIAPPATPEVTITIEGDARLIRANGIPDHPTGAFPGRGNPNRISAQRHSFRVTTKPERAAQPTAVNMSLFGVAVNGVVFDAAAAEWWRDDRASGWQYEALGGGRNLGIDAQHAHVQPTGTYHYHGVPLALVERLTGGAEKMTLVGWAADGFSIYGPWVPTDANDPNSKMKRATTSYRLKSGTRPDGPGGAHDGTYVRDWEFVAGSGDLDECNGRTGATPEYPNGTYYYVLTEEFPFIPRMWRGTPDSSFVRRGPPAGGAPGRGKKKRPANP